LLNRYTLSRRIVGSNPISSARTPCNLLKNKSFLWYFGTPHNIATKWFVRRIKAWTDHCSATATTSLATSRRIQDQPEQLLETTGKGQL
jgi:hypothetical protein